MRPVRVLQNAVRFPLGHLLGTASNVRLLRVLADEVVGPVTASEAAERAGLTEAGARKALAGLARTGFVRRVGGGRAQQYRLREGDPLVEHLVAVFRAERERFEALVALLRDAFGALPDVRQAWIESLPADAGVPLELHFVADAGSVGWLGEELRRRVLPIEERFDMLVELHGFTLAEEPEEPAAGAILLAGAVRRSTGRADAPAPTHDAREARALRLSRAVAVLLDRNPSLIRRAAQHVERILKEDQGSATRDLEEWRAVLDAYSPERVRDLLTSSSPRGERLRQSSPFFAVLTPEERDQVLGAMEDAE